MLTFVYATLLLALFTVTGTGQLASSGSVTIDVDVKINQAAVGGFSVDNGVWAQYTWHEGTP